MVLAEVGVEHELKLNMSNVMPAIYNAVLSVIQKVMHITKNKAAPALSSCQPVDAVVMCRQQETTVTSRCELSIVYCTDAEKASSGETRSARRKQLVFLQEV